VNDIINIIPVLASQANIFICFINIQTDQLKYYDASVIALPGGEDYGSTNYCGIKYFKVIK